MDRTARPRVKVCCIGNLAEAELAIQLGASALGLVSAMPSGPGPIPDGLIAEIAARIPPPLATFLLTASQDPEHVIRQQRASRVNTLQLVDAFPRAGYTRLREALPGIRLVQVIHVSGPASIDEATEVAPSVDALLLDSGNPGLAVKELGGTGRVHDWTISAEIRRLVHVPVFLAGGLRVENVAEAIRRVGPFGVDVCSGVRSAGALDERLLRGFFDAVERAAEPVGVVIRAS